MKKEKSERTLRLVTYNAGWTNRDNYEVHTSTKQVRIISRLEDLQEDIEHLDEWYEWVEILSIVKFIPNKQKDGGENL